MTGEPGQENAEKANQNGANAKQRPSLAKIVLSLDTNSAKQLALGQILTAMQIIYAR